MSAHGDASRADWPNVVKFIDQTRMSLTIVICGSQLNVRVDVFFIYYTIVQLHGQFTTKQT